MTQEYRDIIPLLNQSFEIDMPIADSYEALSAELSSHINFLIRSDFQKLVAILYRVDIDEKKLKQVLSGNPVKDAGSIMAEMIIERQLQKIRSRQDNDRNNNISEDERW